MVGSPKNWLERSAMMLERDFNNHSDRLLAIQHLDFLQWALVVLKLYGTQYIPPSVLNRYLHGRR